MGKALAFVDDMDDLPAESPVASTDRASAEQDPYEDVSDILGYPKNQRPLERVKRETR